MRYLVTMAEPGHFQHWAQLTEADQAAVFECFETFSTAVRERGSMLAGEGLSEPSQARTLGAGPDRVVTDGPYSESAEQVGGFFLVDLPSLDDAVEVARLLPAAYAIEIRPVSNS